MINFKKWPYAAALAAAALSIALSLSIPAAHGAAPVKIMDPSVLFLHNHFLDAAVAYENLLKQQPNNLQDHIGLVRTLFRLDRWKEAESEAQTTVKLAPGSAEANGILALALMRAGKPTAAAIVEKRALSLSADSYWTLVAEARLALWNSNNSLAETALYRATLIHPNWPEAWYYLIDAESQRETMKESDFEDIASYLSLFPKGHPNALTMETLPSRMPLIRATFHNPPFQAIAPISELQMEAADKGAAVQSFTVPVDRQGSYMVIPVNIGGQSAKLLFDTGGGDDITLNSSFLTAMHISPLSKSIILGVNGQEPSSIYLAPSLQIGGQGFGPVPISSSSGTPGNFDGILGVSAFDSYAITIDYQANTITFSRGSTTAAPPPKEGDFLVTTPFHYLEGDIFLPAELGGEEVWALVDTGADAEAMLSLNKAKEAASAMARSAYRTMHINGKFGIGNSSAAQTMLVFGSPLPLRIADAAGHTLTWNIMPALGADMLDKQVSPAEDFEVGGLLGAEWTSGAVRMTIDYPKRTLTLEYPNSRQK